MTDAYNIPAMEPPQTAFLPADTFAGLNVFITGGSSGMGLGMADGFAQAGANIIMMARDPERGKKSSEKLERHGVRAVFVTGDVRNSDSVRAAFDEAESKLGPISILANNAGGNFPVIAEQMSTNQWNAVTRIAIDGTYLCSEEFARRSIAANRQGSIVNNSAQYIWTGFPGDAHSAAAKTAVATMTRAQARKWGKVGIRVNCVAAGFFRMREWGVLKKVHVQAL